MAQSNPKIIIIGGGISGLSIGWYLARAGMSVDIFDMSAIGQAASWAAGGMLAADIETEAGEQALSSLLFHARDFWPEFARDLEQSSQQKIHFQQKGSLYVGRDADDLAKLQFLFSLYQDYGQKPEWLSGYEARQMEPHLSRAIVGAIHHPHDAHVDNRAVITALVAAFTRAGGRLHPNTKVDSIIIDHNRAIGVVANGEKIAGDFVINAAGAWAGEIGGMPQDCIPPVRPVKGQMIAIQTGVENPLLEKLVWSPDIYLIPQPGRLLIGASVEDMGFNTDLTAGVQMDLLNEAFAILPGIYDLPIAESWAGLRPTSRDDAPIYGATPVKNLILATGQHRNGILLAPVTAQAIFDLIQHGKMQDIVGEYTLARFAA